MLGPPRKWTTRNEEVENLTNTASEKVAMLLMWNSKTVKYTDKQASNGKQTKSLFVLWQFLRIGQVIEGSQNNSRCIDIASHHQWPGKSNDIDASAVAGWDQIKRAQQVDFRKMFGNWCFLIFECGDGWLIDRQILICQLPVGLVRDDRDLLDIDRRQTPIETNGAVGWPPPPSTSGCPKMSNCTGCIWHYSVNWTRFWLHFHRNHQHYSTPSQSFSVQWLSGGHEEDKVDDYVNLQWQRLSIVCRFSVTN